MKLFFSSLIDLVKRVGINQYCSATILCAVGLECQDDLSSYSVCQ